MAPGQKVSFNFFHSSISVSLLEINRKFKKLVYEGLPFFQLSLASSYALILQLNFLGSENTEDLKLSNDSLCEKGKKK